MTRGKVSCLVETRWRFCPTHYIRRYSA